MAAAHELQPSSSLPVWRGATHVASGDVLRQEMTSCADSEEWRRVGEAMERVSHRVMQAALCCSWQMQFAPKLRMLYLLLLADTWSSSEQSPASLSVNPLTRLCTASH